MTAARQPPGAACQEPSAEALIAAGQWIGDGTQKKRLAVMFDSFASLKVAEGYDAAVKALRTAKPEQIPKPTIAEIEAILNSPAPAVHINPDGSISAGQGQFEKAADWLAANRPSSTAIAASKVAEAIAAERERCARIADNYKRDGENIREYACETADEIAARIRASERTP